MTYYCRDCKLTFTSFELIEDVDEEPYEAWGQCGTHRTIALCCPECGEEVEETRATEEVEEYETEH